MNVFSRMVKIRCLKSNLCLGLGLACYEIAWQSLANFISVDAGDLSGQTIAEGAQVVAIIISSAAISVRNGFIFGDLR